jgi:hypothetical protein
MTPCSAASCPGSTEHRDFHDGAETTAAGQATNLEGKAEASLASREPGLMRQIRLGVFYGLLWSSMLLIFSNFRIAELGIAWRTCEMDRILCHKAVALMDALELGACLKGSLALLIFGTFSIFSFQKTYRYTDHTQIMHRSYTDHILLSPRLGPNMCWKQISNRANDNANLQPRAH